MCGIVGFVGHEDAWPIIFEGLQRLEYRGYDSAGIAVVDPDGELQFRKTVGKVNGLGTAHGSDLLRGSAGLGHTRWATHGRPSQVNAHPHTDCHHRIAVVHNGIVENFLELKRRLQAEGHRFASETDTEVITHLVEDGLDQGLSFEEAFLLMGHAIKGSQAITAMQQGQEGKICAMRLGHAGGIVVAHNEGQGIVGSDLPAVLPILKRDHNGGKVGFLESGEIAVVTREGVDYIDLDGKPLNKGLRTVSPEEIVIDKGGHRHFMLKEIMEQPQAVASALRERVNFEAGRVELPGFPLSTEEVIDLQRVVLIGCGTSLNAAMVGRHLMETLGGLPAEAESASEYRYRDPYLDARTLVVSVGQSGETADTVGAMHMVREKGARLITICNAEGSQASRLAEHTIQMRSGIEIGVASTKTFIASLTILNLLATYLGQVRGHLTSEDCRRLVDDLASAPRMVGSLLTDDAAYQDLARQYSKFNHFLFLGRGINTPVAMEGALKLKEVSYIHAEGYSAGEMKHGPIALIDTEMATMAVAPKDALYDKVCNNIKEVKARNGTVLAVITEGDEDLASGVDHTITIPHAPDHLIPLLATVPLQLLAYHIAVLRGCDVDQPRNLAKTVTVE
ncbi:MAG: glutamine--fructose-6-phosphate transaminase (isomerizing) [SAR202 cluster bacterium Io17-Chloro-G9]|nr:MAG: glutamine--fructose-6-phosphate transaminase (isomerizing) [SAR202 cluster bacterium Io17-Chloro-G9]